ncbi:hypothetical protein [Streptomyces sp. NPDC059122]|uniref:hypothetical protein n=1 Tax=Streptomyces sp. NPDC059122 TaxID=3346732 RepID=UPI0036A4FBC3
MDAHGQQWPHGWVKGRGFVEPDTDPDDFPFVDWATRYVDRLTGIDERTREDHHRDIRIHLSLLQHTTRAGVVTPAPNLTTDDIQDWVRVEERGRGTRRTRRSGAPTGAARRCRRWRLMSACCGRR